VLLSGFLVFSKREIAVLKDFIDNVVYGLSDSAKAFIILFTDIFLTAWMGSSFYQAYPDISDYQKITTLSFVYCNVPSNFRYCIQVLDFPVLESNLAFSGRHLPQYE